MKDKQYWVRWFKSTAVRAIRTMAEISGSYITIGLAINEIDWLHMLSVTAVSGIATFLLALKGLPEIEVKEELPKVEIEEYYHEFEEDYPENEVEIEEE